MFFECEINDIVERKLENNNNLQLYKHVFFVLCTKKKSKIVSPGRARQYMNNTNHLISKDKELLTLK